MFVFKDMDDFKSRGKNIDEQYNKLMANKKKKGGDTSSYMSPVIQKPEEKPPVVIPADIVGKRVKHTTFGSGKIIAIDGSAIVIEFDSFGTKKLGYEFCMEKHMLEFV